MNLMQSAFLKAKLVNESDVRRVEEEKQEERKPKKIELPVITAPVQEPQAPVFGSEPSPFLDAVEAQYANDKSRKFVIHLIHAYLDPSRAVLVIEKDMPDGKKCPIAGLDLISAQKFQELGEEHIARMAFKSDTSDVFVSGPGLIALEQWFWAKVAQGDVNLNNLVTRWRIAELHKTALRVAAVGQSS